VGAFERAVEHYRALLTLEGLERDATKTRQLKLALSEALASAGQCAESARVLLDTLEGASEEEAPDLALRAAQRLLQAAQVAEGLAAAEKAFDLLGLAWPKTRGGVVARMLWNRARIAVRGFDLRGEEVASATGDATRRRRELDALKRLVLPTGWADLLRSAELSSRHTCLALAARDPEHLAYALSSEGGMRAMWLAPESEVEGLFGHAAKWRERRSGPEGEAYEKYCRGNAAVFTTHLRQAEENIAAAEALYATWCPGSAWELTNVRGALLCVVYAQGRFRQHAEYAQRWYDEAATRDDRFALATFAVAGLGCIRHIYCDAPERAHAELAQAIAPWRGTTAGMQFFMEALVQGAILSYVGGDGAEEYWAEHWARLERSFLFRMHFLQESLLTTRLGTLLARSSGGGLAPAARKEAQETLQSLRRAKSNLGQIFVALFGAQVAFLEGDLPAASRSACIARERCQAVGHFLASVADVLAARAENAPDAAEREQRVLDWLSSEGFVQPEKALFWLLPVARAWR
jgi:hypothetical protein